MNVFLIAALCLSFSIPARSQTLKEWTEQGKTQIEYLLNQIEALNIYRSYLEKGYDVAEKGINVIKDIKNKRFSMHDLYFSSLSQVSPEIKNLAPGSELSLIQDRIVKNCVKMRRILNEPAVFRDEEINYITKVSDHVLENASEISYDIQTLLSSGLLEMKEDERIKKIVLLLNDLEGVLRFSHSLLNDVASVSQQLKLDLKQVDRSRKIFGIK